MQRKRVQKAKKVGEITPRVGIRRIDKFMSRIEHNSDMIRNLTYKIDELKELIEKLIKDSPPPLKE
jgi:hypothetical protein